LFTAVNFVSSALDRQYVSNAHQTLMVLEYDCMKG
jgi:hypothetical protein